PYDPTDKSGFSYETVVKRWPTIITGVVEYLHHACQTLSIQLNGIADRDGEKRAAL
ncbi:hypothetical protein BDZ97DRAFT_1828074, partial [Flammula alnicola]